MDIKTHTGIYLNENDSSSYEKTESASTDLNYFSDQSSLLTLLLANSQELILIVDLEYNIQLFNEHTRSEINKVLQLDLHKGMSVFMLLPAERVQYISQTFDAVFKGASMETVSTYPVGNKENRYFRNFFQPVRNKKNAVVGAMIIAKEITDEKKAKKALKENEQFWQSALAGSHQGVWDWDMVSNIVFYSPSYEKMYGFETGELSNNVEEWFERIHPDDRSKINSAVKDHYNSNDPHYDTFYRIKTKSGTYKWVIARGSIISKDADGKPARMIGTHTDVTDFKTIEENYKILFHHNPLPLWTCDLKTHKFLDVNKKAIDHYGYSREEFLNMTVIDLLPEEDRQLQPIDQKNKINLHFSSSHIRHKKKNGEVIYVDLSGHIIEKDSTKISLVISNDITEKMAAEEKLQQSEVKYRTLFENNPLPSWIFDSNTQQFLDVNKAALQQYGYSEEEFLKLNIPDLHPPWEKELAKQTVQKVINKPTHHSSWAHVKKNGEIMYVDLLSSDIIYNQKRARLVVVHDKTKQVLTEKELRISNERFRLASLATSEVLWEWNIEQDDLYLSDAYTTIFGWKTTDKKLSEWQYYIHPDDRSQTMKAFGEIILNPKLDHWQREYRYLRANGTYAYIIDKAFILRDQEGKATKVVGAIEDITRQKEAEEAILLSNERFKFASRATSDAIWDLDLQTNRLEWGEGLQTLFGYQSDEVSYEKWAQLVHPDDAEKVETSLVNAIYHTNENIWRSLYRFKAANGSFRYVLDRGFILRTPDGKPYRAIGSLQDITDLKEKEKELIKSNDRYKYASLATSDIVMDWNLKKENTHLSDNFKKIFGWELPSDNKISIEEFFSHTHPEDRIRVWEEARLIINDPKSNFWSSTFRYAKANGSYAIVSLKGYVIRNQAFEGLRMIGAIQDITEKTLKEKELTESKERFEAVLQATHDLIWDWNLETGEFYRDREGLEKVYGVCNADDIKSFHTWLQRIHPEDYQRVQKIINNILNEEVEDTFELEYRFKRDNGRFSHVYDRGRILRNKEGLPIRMIGAAQDITERKKLEKQLLIRELDKQKLISRATIETQEQERSEIGKELHDNVNQVLTTTKLYLELSLSNVEMKDELIVKSSKNIMYVINEIRQLSRSLMNPSLGDLGLFESINDLIENIHLTGKLKVNLTSDPSLEEQLNENQKLMIYRIVQEALNNILKHAKANSVNIRVIDMDQDVELIIEDDGIGFNFDTVRKGAGLKHIQNRVYLANGTLSVNSIPNEGSKIFIKFPINTNNPT